MCPLMDLADSRCATHFSLTRLSDAFTHCAGRYQDCPVYQRRVNDRVTTMSAGSAVSVGGGHSRLAG
jgi:hypothetical protein